MIFILKKLLVERGWFRPCLVHPKNQNYFKILYHIESYDTCMMHGALNIDENKNYLHSLQVNYEMNLLSLNSLWLDNNYQIKIKVLKCPEKKLRTKQVLTGWAWGGG